VSSTRSRTDELEGVGYELWRAPEVAEIDGWRLRFAHGVSGRANSVWPNGDGTLPVDEKIARTEEWYRARRAPVLFQLTDAARPAGLDAALEARGYGLRGDPVSVETAVLDDVLAGTEGEADLTVDLDDAWLELWAGTRGFSNLEAARAVLEDGRVAFARIDDSGVGRGVAVGEWLGITALVTLPEARRRGHARAIVHELARWGVHQRCTRALVQVESTNTPARALFAGAGFVPHHEYHYRLLP
jgi:N-acetylglutamate synthase